MHLSHRRRGALALAAALAAGLTPPAAPVVAAAGAERVPVSATAQPTPGLAPASGAPRRGGRGHAAGHDPGGATNSPLIVLGAAGAVLAAAAGGALGLREPTRRAVRDVVRGAGTPPAPTPAPTPAPVVSLPVPAAPIAAPRAGIGGAAGTVVRTRHRELYESEYAQQLERLRALRHRHERKT